MVLWVDCTECDGSAGYWETDKLLISPSPTPVWIECEACEGTGQVRFPRPVGPADDIEEEVTRA